MQKVKFFADSDSVQGSPSKVKKDFDASFESVSISGSNCYSPLTLLVVFIPFHLWDGLSFKSPSKIKMDFCFQIDNEETSLKGLTRKATDTFPATFENKQEFKITLGLADGKSLESLELYDKYFESAEERPQKCTSPTKKNKYDSIAKQKLRKQQQPDNQASSGLEANEKQYFELEPFKIFWGLSKEAVASKTDVRCINLLVNECKITENHGQEFSLSIQGLDSTLKLKAASKQECKEWVEFLNEFFQFAKEHRKEICSHTRTIENLFRPDVMLEEEFLESVDTGDLLLLRANHVGAKLQRLFTFSDYDHVAVMLRAANEIYIFDTVYENGVQLTNWNDFKKRGHYLDYPVASYRKLHIQDAEAYNDAKTKIWEFAAQHVGKKYELGIGKFLRNSNIFNSQVHLSLVAPESSYLDNTSSPSNVSPKMNTDNSKKRIVKKSISTAPNPEEGFFCSELVASAYKNAGLLDAAISSVRYLPVSFSQKKEKGLGLLRNASLSHEQGLAFIEEERFKK